MVLLCRENLATIRIFFYISQIVRNLNLQPYITFFAIQFSSSFLEAYGIYYII